jgi:hypothetical protein
MKAEVHTLETLNRHGTYFEVFGSLSEAEAAAAKYCRERFAHEIHEHDGDDIDFAKATDRRIVDYCLEEFASDDDNLEFEVVEISLPEPPAVALLREAVEAWPQTEIPAELRTPGCIPDEREGEEINGGDLVEWWGGFYGKAKAIVEGKAA